MNKKIIIAGAGGIGSASGLMLRELGDFSSDLYIGDLDVEASKGAAEWISKNSDKDGLVEPFKMPRDGTDETFDEILRGGDIIIDCLPGSQAPRIAKLARINNLHYVNLTEYVKETNEIMEIAEGASTAFILQSGLAPGFINILAHGLFQDFCEEYGVDKVGNINMKVGALTTNAVSPHFYGFTWSPIGVATEYVEPAVVVRDFNKIEVKSLNEKAKIVIGGVTYEEALTSGGVANLPEKLAGKVRNLDYKTLRHSGHYKWIEDQIKDIKQIQGSDKLADKLQLRMMKEIPLVSDDDFIVIYASVDGKDRKGNYRIKEKKYMINPMKVGGKSLKAIQSTTAASAAECVRMALRGGYKGVVLQCDIDPKEFMKGPFVSKVY